MQSDSFVLERGACPHVSMQSDAFVLERGACPHVSMQSDAFVLERSQVSVRTHAAGHFC
jgi:hypothetical protein